MPEDKDLTPEYVDETAPETKVEDELEFDLEGAKQKVADKVLAGKELTNADVLLAQGLVEIYDPAVQAYRQVPVIDAKRMIEANKELAKSLKGL